MSEPLQIPSAPGPAPGGLPVPPSSLMAMLEARSVALVGASARPGSLGQRMVTEVARSPAAPRAFLVNPKYPQIGGTRCYPSLADVPEPVDLVLLAVPDAALERQLAVAAGRGDRSAVIFGGAYDLAPRPHAAPGQHQVPGQAPGSLRSRLAAIAHAAGMALCGAGCMGFVNIPYGLRALGYLEADPLPAGPVALVTHSGSVFSALLRTRRALGFTVAVSSGQELVTSAARYAHYALCLPQTRVLALVLEAMRDTGLLQQVLATAQARGLPVVLLTVGRTASGREMVAAHSGALAGEDGAWEALAGAYGVHRVGDLAELTDTLELFAIGRRAPPLPGGGGLATVHDSGLERAHIADLASDLGVRFAAISQATTSRLAQVLDPGLEPANPLDMWGASEQAQWQLTQSLIALAEDPAVAAVALAVDLVTEFDGDRSYPRALADAARAASKPMVVLAGIPAAIDLTVAAGLRGDGIPVLEGTRSGLLALRHLFDHALPPGRPVPPSPDLARQARWARRLARWRRSGEIPGAGVLRLLSEYGIPVARSRAVRSERAALAAAAAAGYPVVLKTDEPGIAHKSDVGGVMLGLAGPAELAAAYRDLAARLGPRALVCETAGPGVELAVGITRDPVLGPLVVAGAGGVLVEHLADRAVALPPLDEPRAAAMVARLRVARLLGGVRGRPAAELTAVARAIVSVSAIAGELGGELSALDVNPLICGADGATAVDALAVLQRR